MFLSAKQEVFIMENYAYVKYGIVYDIPRCIVFYHSIPWSIYNS